MRAIATIRTAIQINDMLSQQFRAMNMAMATVIDSFQTLQDTTSHAIDIQALNAAQQELQQVEANFNQIEQEIRQANEEQQRFNDRIRDGTDSASGLLGKLVGIAAAYMTFQTGKNILSLSDTMTNTVARLDMMNDGLQTTAELQQMIFDSAQRSYGSYLDTADLVGKLAMNAGDAFGSNRETVAFAELLNKQFAIAGTSADEMRNSTIQLVQALGSGVLRGDELNSIFEQAPTIIQSIADYMDEPIGRIRDLAADGEITAQIVKASMFAAADDINTKFESMPLTFGQIWTSFQNEALKAFEPVLQKLNEIANNDKFQGMMDSLVNSLYILSNVAFSTISVLMSIGGFLYDNWSIIEPIIWGIIGAFAAYGAIIGIQTVATMAYTAVTWLAVAANRALIVTMLSNPIMWIAIAIGFLIAMIYNWVQSVGGLEIAWKIAMNGILTAWDWVKIGFFTGVYWVMDMLNKLQLGFMTASAAVQNFMGDMKAGTLMILQNLVNEAIDIINDFISALNMIPGVSIDFVQSVSFGTMAQLDNEIAKKSREAELNEYRDQIEATMAERDSMLDKMKADALNAKLLRQEEIGMMQVARLNDPSQKLKNAIEEAMAGLKDSIADGNKAGKDTAGNTKKLANSVDMAAEDLKYLRDIAEREAINRYTTAEINIDMKNENHINSEMDIDGVIDRFGERAEEVAEMLQEGV